MNSILQVIPIFVGFSQIYTVFLYNMTTRHEIISTSKMNNAKEQISDLEERIMEITQLGQLMENQMKK